MTTTMLKEKAKSSTAMTGAVQMITPIAKMNVFQIHLVFLMDMGPMTLITKPNIVTILRYAAMRRSVVNIMKPIFLISHKKNPHVVS